MVKAGAKNSFAKVIRVVLKVYLCGKILGVGSTLNNKNKNKNWE